MKLLFPLPLMVFVLTLLLSACGDDKKADIDENIDDVFKNDVIYPSTDTLVGKTVDEYQDIVADKKEKAAETSVANKDKPLPLDEPEIEKDHLPLKWEGLIAPGFDADSIIKKYDPIIATLKEGSEEADKLYQKMQAEYNKAPANEALANKKVSIPGFIAPLEQNNGIITEFLLVPYFGACIHQPAPPSNQTVHVKTAAESGIRVEDAYDPIWVSGELLIDKSTTDIGSASYKVKQAKIQKYDM